LWRTTSLSKLYSICTHSLFSPILHASQSAFHVNEEQEQGNVAVVFREKINSVEITSERYLRGILASELPWNS
jgi:hypothetical protein